MTDAPRHAGKLKTVIIPAIHGKLARNGKICEPDIHYIVEKWLERHPEFKDRERDIQILCGPMTTRDGMRTELIRVTMLSGGDIDSYDPSEDQDLYEYWIAEDQDDRWLGLA